MGGGCRLGLMAASAPHSLWDQGSSQAVTLPSQDEANVD